MHKAFQLQILWAGFPKLAHFINIKLARQNHAVDAKGGKPGKLCGIADIGQGGEGNVAGKPCLPGNDQHGRILDDKAIHRGLGHKTACKAPGAFDFARLDEAIYGHINTAVVCMGQFQHPRQLPNSKIFGLHTRGKMLEAKIDCIRAGSQGRQKTVLISGWRQYFWRINCHEQPDCRNSPCASAHRPQCRS